MEFDKYRKKIQNAFKLSGYTIKSELCLTILENWDEDKFEDLNDWIDKIIDNVQNQSLSHSNLLEKDIEIAVQNSLSSGLDNTETVINVISAYEIPKFNYNVDRKKFLKDTTSNFKYFPNADAKSELFNYRYTMVLQRVLRNELFKPSILGDKTDSVQLLSIESLLSTGKKRNNAIVLGLLSQISEGKWFLEDPTGILELDLTQTRYHTGLYTENSIVLCDGTFEDKMLLVQGMAHPPIEASIDSREYFGDVNTFGGISRTSLKYSKHLLQLENENKNGIIFISDVWLDKIEVMQKLKIFFDGFNSVPPIAFVFLGNFLSGDKGSERAYELKSLLKGLSELISSYPNLLKHSSFIFVPGRYDPSAANVLPRPPLPGFITEEFRKKIPKSTFTTNPCRIQYCTQEIIVIREDLLTKMFRNTIYFPDKNDNITEHFTKTILGQGHLSPFTLNVLPTYWCYDYALSLYPIPDVLVIGDQFKSFSQNFHSCDVINPGPFSTNDYSFKVYYPATKEIDDSCIPSDI